MLKMPFYFFKKRVQFPEAPHRSPIPMCIKFFFFLGSVAIFCLGSLVTRSGINLPLCWFGMIPPLTPLDAVASMASPVAICQDLPPGSQASLAYLSHHGCAAWFLVNHFPRRVAITICLPISPTEINPLTTRI